LIGVKSFGAADAVDVCYTAYPDHK